MLKYNSANVNILKRLGSALSSLKFNGVSVWSVSRDSVFTFELSAADPTIDLWLTQSAARAVTVTMDDGTVLTSSQLKAEFPYRFSSGGTHTVTVEVEDGESWYPVVATNDTINFVGKSANGGESDYKLESVSLGGGLNAYLVGIAAMFAFYRCRGLVSADFSGFDDDAILGFMDCTGLENIVFGSNHYNVGAGAFQGCTGLSFVSVPANIDKVISFAFAGCTGIINLEVGADEVQEQAFAGCTLLEKIWLRSTITTIGDTDKGPWEGCPSGALLYCEPNAQPSGWKRSFDEYDNANDLHYLAQWGQTTAPWGVLEPMLVGLAIPAATTLTIPFRTPIKENDPTTDALPLTIDWGDGTTEELTGELKSVVLQGVTNYYYSGTATHNYQSGNYTLRFQRPRGSEVLRIVRITNSNNSKENVVSIDARGGTWLLPDMGDITSTSTRFTTLHVGNNPVGSVGFNNCAHLDVLTFGNNASIGDSAFGGCTSLGPNLEINAKTIVRTAFVDCSGLRKVWLRESVKTAGSYLFDSDSYVGKLPIETIYCEADSKPEGWSNDWGIGVDRTEFNIVWGQKTRPW